MTESRCSQYHISHHAISRIYQRLRFEKLTGDDIQAAKIIRELRYIPLWVSYWNLIKHSGLTTLGEFESLTLPIPSDNGLFFAKWAPEKSLILIRTFVDDNKLSNEQIRVRNIFVEISADLLSSPIPYFFELFESEVEKNTAILLSIHLTLPIDALFDMEFL